MSRHLHRARRRATRPLLAAAALGVTLVFVAGCGTQVDGGPGAGGTGIPSLDEPATTDAPTDGAPNGSDQTPAATTTAGSDVPRSRTFDDRAGEVATAWLREGLTTTWREGLVPLGALTRPPDSTERPELKAAFGSGWVDVTGTLPSLKRPVGEVTVGSSTQTVGLLSAEQALKAALPDRSPDCAPAAPGAAGCVTAEVTGAALVTTTLLTNRGEAQVPAWAFTVAGLTDPLVQVAISPEDFDTAPTDLTPIPSTDGDRSRGVVASQGLIGVDGSSITFTVGVGACDTDVVPRVVETKDLVLVGATVTTTMNAVCTDQLLIQPVQVRTTEPVGGRPVVDALTGAAVLPSFTPR